MTTATPKVGDRIVYFLTIRIRNQVHVAGLGFTQVIFMFAFANSQVEATQLAKAYCEENRMTAWKIDATYAHQQDLSRYVFPEQILRDRPLATVWRGEVVVHPANVNLLTDIGATLESHRGAHVFVFSAPEAIAVRINSNLTNVIGSLKPYVGAPVQSTKAARAAA